MIENRKRTLKTCIATAMVLCIMNGVSAYADDIQEQTPETTTVTTPATTPAENTQIHEVEIKKVVAPTEKPTQITTVSKSDMKKYEKFLNAGLKALFNKKTIAISNSLGINGLKSYDFTKATQNFDKAISFNPNGAEAYAYRAELYRYKGDKNKAEEFAQKALSINPRNAYANFILGSLYTESDEENAIKYLTKAIECDSTLSKAYLNRGNVYFFQKKYDKAISDYTHAISLNPQLDVAYSGRADAYFLNKQYTQSISDSNYLIKKYPTNVKYLFNRALCYAELNNTPMALADINKAVTLEPNNVDAYTRRLFIYSKINASETLVKHDVDKIHELLPNDQNKLAEIVKILCGIGYYDDAIKVGNKAIAMNPDNPEIYYSMANASINAGLYKNAYDLLATYKTKTADISADTNYLTGVAELGMAGRNNKTLLQSGIDSLTKSINDNVNTANSYLYRGSAKILLGDYTNGYNDLKQYLSMVDNPSPVAYHQMGFAEIITNWNNIKYDKNGKFLSWSGKPLGQNNEFNILVGSYPQDVCANINYLCTQTDKEIASRTIHLINDSKCNIAYFKPLKVVYSPTNVLTSMVTSPYINALGDVASDNNCSIQNKALILAELKKLKLKSQMGNAETITQVSTSEIDEFFDSLIDYIPKDKAIDMICEIISLTKAIFSFTDDYTIPRRIYSSADYYLRNNYCTDCSAASKYIMRESNEYLGHIASEEKNIDDTISYYNIAIKYGANKTQLYKYIANMYIDKGDNSSRIEDTIDYYNMAIKYGANKSQLYKNIANMYIDKGDNADSMEDTIYYYNMAVKYGANKGQLYKYIANMYIDRGDEEYNNGNLNTAIYYYNTATNYGYSKFDVYNHIGNLYYYKDRWFDASVYYSKALAIKKNADAYFRRGYSHQKMNDNSAAIADYTKCIGLNKNYSEAYWNRASIYFKRRQWSLALNDYKRYSALNKSSAAAVYNMAACTYNMGNKKAAYPIYARAKGMYKAQRDTNGYNSCVRIMNEINGYYY